MQLTLLFSFFITACFIVFADDFGRTFYQSEEAGRLIRFLAPLIPLLYLDSVVDGILKGWTSKLPPCDIILQIPDYASYWSIF